jgi:hypothetical protein
MNYLRTKATDLKRSVNLKKAKGEWSSNVQLATFVFFLLNLYFEKKKQTI